MLQFTVPGKPISTNQAYKTSKYIHGMYMTPEGKQYKKDIGWIAKSTLNGRELMKGDVTVTFKFIFGDKRVHDIDGAIKLSLDAMSKIIYEDDKQVNEMHTYKSYEKGNPRVEITINNYRDA